MVFGDADSIPPTHAAQFFELLGGGKRDAGRDGAGMSSARLAILSGTPTTIFCLPGAGIRLHSFCRSMVEDVSRIMMLSRCTRSKASSSIM